MSREPGNRKVLLDIDMLEKATIVYDSTTDTLHINLSEEEAEEVTLLENNIIVRIKDGKLVGAINTECNEVWLTV